MEASDLPRPPSYPGSLEEFIQHINDHSDAWYDYISAADSQLSHLTSDNLALRTQIASQKAQLSEKEKDTQKLTF